MVDEIRKFRNWKYIIIAFNHITNASGKGISVWSYYKNFTIENNYIENASQGIWVYDSNFGEISNGIIANNTLVNISYNGIHAFTSFSGNVIENLHVTNKGSRYVSVFLMGTFFETD